MISTSPSRVLIRKVHRALRFSNWMSPHWTSEKCRTSNNVRPRVQRPIFRKILKPRLAELVHTEYREGTKVPFFHLFAHRSTHARFQLHFASYLVISALQSVRHILLVKE